MLKVIPNTHQGQWFCFSLFPTVLSFYLFSMAFEALMILHLISLIFYTRQLDLFLPVVELIAMLIFSCRKKMWKKKLLVEKIGNVGAEH